MKDEFGKGFYAIHAPWYDLNLLLNGYRRTAHDFVDQLSVGHRVDSILDAGAGTGLYTLPLAEKFPYAHVVAVDTSREMLSRLTKSAGDREIKNIETVEGDVLQYVKSNPNSIDLLVTGGVLEYLPLEEGINALARAVQSSGTWVHAPVRDNFFGRAIGLAAGFQPHARSELLSRIGENGFRLVGTHAIPKTRLIFAFKEIWILKRDQRYNDVAHE